MALLELSDEGQLNHHLKGFYNNLINTIKTKKDNKMKIEISNIFKERLTKINDKVSNFLLGNLEIDEENVKSNYPQYLDFDGNLVTYINSNKKENDPWGCSTRQGTKAVKVLRKVYTEKFINENLTQRDIENFVASWNASQTDTCKIVVYKGWDILKAFNFSNGLDILKFQASCANFKQEKAKEAGKSSWEEPMAKWFYFYIYNEGISTAVVIENDIIKSRSVIFSGEQIEDNKDYKKGKTYTFLNGLYSEGEEKYKHILSEWAKEKGYYRKDGDHLIDPKNNNILSGIFKLTGFKLHYKTYPPVDSICAKLDKRPGEDSYISNHFSDNLVSLYKYKQNGGLHKQKNRQEE